MNDFDKHVKTAKQEIEKAILEGCNDWPEINRLIENLANDCWEMGYKDGQEDSYDEGYDAGYDDGIDEAQS